MIYHLSTKICRIKEDKSPKPKKKFGSNFGSTLRKSAIGSIRKPNMANFKQKIKNKLRKGQWLTRGLIDDSYPFCETLNGVL